MLWIGKLRMQLGYMEKSPYANCSQVNNDVLMAVTLKLKLEEIQMKNLQVEIDWHDKINENMHLKA